MTTTAAALTAFPTSIDLHALHAAFRAEGFADVTTEGNLGAGDRRYVKDINGQKCEARVPAIPADDSNLIDYIEKVHYEARAALLFLVEVTGNQHFECGPTSVRERTMIEALNLLRTSTVAQTCSCGNAFGGDNFCMPSACQFEE